MWKKYGINRSLSIEIQGTSLLYYDVSLNRCKLKKVDVQLTCFADFNQGKVVATHYTLL